MAARLLALLALLLLAPPAWGANVVFIEGGGDATSGLEFYDSTTAPIASSTTTPHTGPRNLRITQIPGVAKKNSVLADAGRRCSGYTAREGVNSDPLWQAMDGSGNLVFDVTVNASLVTLFNGDGSVIKQVSNATFAGTGWHRLAVAYVITSTSNWTVKLYGDGTLLLTGTQADATLTRTGSSALQIGNNNSTAVRWDDIYCDDGTDLADPGDIRVTVKLPAANSTDGWDTVIGTCANHWDCVNERPLSTTNGLEQSANTSQATQTFTVDAASAGDVNTTGATYVGYMAYAWAKKGTAGGLAAGSSCANQSDATTAAGTTTTCTLTIAVNDLVAVNFADQIGSTAPTIADNGTSGGNTYTQCPASATTNTVRKSTWWTRATKTATTITATHASSAAGRAIVGKIITGTIASPSDVCGTDTNDSTSPYDGPPSGTLASDRQVVFGSFALAGPGSDTLAAGASESGIVSAGSNQGRQALTTNGTHSCTANSKSNVTHIDCSINANVGDVLVAVGADQIGTGTFVISGGDGGGWTTLTGATNTVRCTAAYQQVTTAFVGNNVTATFSGNTNTKGLTVRRITGTQSSALDKNPAMLNDSTSAYTGNLSGTTSQTNEIAIPYFCLAGPTADTIAASTNTTDIVVGGTTGGSAGSNSTAVVGQATLSATTSQAYSITDTTSNRTGIAGVATFKTTGNAVTTDAIAALTWRIVSANTTVTPEMTDSTANRTGIANTMSFKGVASATPQLVRNGTDVALTLTTSSALYTSVATSGTYPSGAFGMKSQAPQDTYMYETGALVAYVPAAASTTCFRNMLGIGNGMGRCGSRQMTDLDTLERMWTLPARSPERDYVTVGYEEAR